ncbi:mite allergen Eur m 3-like [Diachasmimorpha longicaudata]|uniref:mite allergen Eur m 3-like n=1 Tax=Diachasmimorpha longicaudata TaxID=58733 RepID=UPI0030B90D28
MRTIMLSLSYCLIILILSAYIHDVNSMDGGLRAKPGEFPYVASIWYRSHHICSGTIIDTLHILTAAHCVQGKVPTDISVLPGVVDFEKDAREWFGVESYRQHPSFEIVPLEGWAGQYSRNDIAVLRLQKPLVLSPRVGIATFWDGKIEADGLDDVPHRIDAIDAVRADENNMDTEDDCLDDDSSNDSSSSGSTIGMTALYKIPGWDYNGGCTKSLYLLWVDSFIYPYKFCVDTGKILFENQLCASDEDHATIAAQGDSGTPVLLDGSVVGIVTGGATQPDGRVPITILRTSPYLDFIAPAARAYPQGTPRTHGPII